MKNQNTPSQSKLSLTALALTVSTAVASAHPGHALDAEPLAHTFASPYHLLTLALLGGGLLLGGRFVKRLATRRALQVTGVAALGIATLTAAAQMLH